MYVFVYNSGNICKANKSTVGNSVSFFLPDCPCIPSVCNVIVISTWAKISWSKFYDKFLINLGSIQVMRCMKNSNFGAAVYSAVFSDGNEPANHLTQVLLMEHVVIKYTWSAWVSQDVLHDTKKVPCKIHSDKMMKKKKLKKD